MSLVFSMGTTGYAAEKSEGTNLPKASQQEILTIMNEAAQNPSPSTVEFGVAPVESNGGMSALSFSSMATGTTDIDVEYFTPTISYIKADGKTTASNILYYTSSTTSLWYSATQFGSFTQKNISDTNYGFSLANSKLAGQNRE